MDLARLKRYKDKLNLVSRRIQEIQEWQEDFLKQEKDKLACYKALQEAVEGCFDLIAMMVKDEGQIPKDDYVNLELLGPGKQISLASRGFLAEANGLRNRIVHEYNGLDDYKAHRSMLALLPHLEEFLEEVELWIKKKSSPR
ncbi:MAG: DUF86 domain-containing protein [Nanoarchaeota archaeon]